MRRAFTLIELLMVVGLMGVIASFSTYIGIGAYQHALARADIERITSLMTHARAAAMHHQCSSGECESGHPHGVHVEHNLATVFEGAEYERRSIVEDFSLPLNSLIENEASSSIVFDSRGDTNVSGLIVTNTAGTWILAPQESGLVRAIRTDAR